MGPNEEFGNGSDKSQVTVKENSLKPSDPDTVTENKEKTSDSTDSKEGEVDQERSVTDDHQTDPNNSEKITVKDGPRSEVSNDGDLPHERIEEDSVETSEVLNRKATDDIENVVSDHKNNLCENTPLDTCEKPIANSTISQTTEITIKNEGNSDTQTSPLTNQESNKKDENKAQTQIPKKSYPINVNLDFDINDFYKSFNKTNDCIKRLFKGIEEDSIFKEEISDSSLVLSPVPKDVFKGNGSDNKILSGCYIYNFKVINNKQAQRLEIAVQTENEGWIWMMGSVPTVGFSNSQTTWYREFILEKIENSWKTTFAHEGKVELQFNPMEPNKKLNLAYGFPVDENKRWVDLKTNSECLNSKQQCESLSERAFSAYWKPNNSSEKTFDKSWSNTEEQILRWGKYQNQIYGAHYENNRQKIYKDGKWYKNLGGYANQALIKLKDNDLKNTKGEWENLYRLCKDSSQQNDKYFEIFCNSDSTEFVEEIQEQLNGGTTVENSVISSPTTLDTQPVESAVTGESQTTVREKQNETGPLEQLERVDREAVTNEHSTSEQQDQLDNKLRQEEKEFLVESLSKNQETPDVNRNINHSDPERAYESQLNDGSWNHPLFGTENSEQNNDDDEINEIESFEETQSLDEVEGIEGGSDEKINLEKGTTYSGTISSEDDNNEDCEEDEEELWSDSEFIRNQKLIEDEIKKAREQYQKALLKNNVSINYQLDFHNNNFYKSFNKPGDCLTKLFKGISEDPIFVDNNTDNNISPEWTTKSIFKNNKEVNLACYMYNFKRQNNSERLEIALKGKDEGWVWMMGSQRDPGTRLQKIWYREFLLENTSTWKVTAGQEGEIVSNDDLQINTAKFLGENKFSPMWFDAWMQKPCSQTDTCDNGGIHKSLNLYWKQDNYSDEKMNVLSDNTSDQILRWGDAERQKLINQYRKRIYLDGKWYTKVKKHKNKELIKFEERDLSKWTGEWSNLYELCNGKNKKEDDDYYNMYCKQ